MTPSTDRQITRRQAGLGIASILTSLGAVSYCHAQANSDSEYVDVHIHLTPSLPPRNALTVDLLLKWMDEKNVKQAWILPLVSPESWFFPITTAWVLKQTKPHRDRLIPFCSIDPRTPYMSDDKLLRDTLKRYINDGAKGFGEHKWGGAFDDPRNIQFLRACGDLDLPVLFHLDELRNTDKPGLPGLEKALKECPKTTLIGHGPGWWASIDADPSRLDGYPKGKVTPGGALDRLLGKYKNLHGDLSAGSGANSISRDTTFGRAFLIRNADQLMFGTDYLQPGQNVPQFELFESLNLPAEVKEKIYHRNAKKMIAN